MARTTSASSGLKRTATKSSIPVSLTPAQADYYKDLQTAYRLVYSMAMPDEFGRYDMLSILERLPLCMVSGREEYFVDSPYRPSLPRDASMLQPKAIRAAEETLPEENTVNDVPTPSSEPVGAATPGSDPRAAAQRSRKSNNKLRFKRGRRLPLTAKAGERSNTSLKAAAEPDTSEYSRGNPWQPKHALRTSAIAVVLCLIPGTDPPDVFRVPPCASLEAWVDMQTLPADKAGEVVGERLLHQYSLLHHRANMQVSVDPTFQDLSKLLEALRKRAEHKRLLLHFNGHGVPKPTPDGELWVFDPGYTQYVPIRPEEWIPSLGIPSILLMDSNGSGNIISIFARAQACLKETGGVEHMMERPYRYSLENVDLATFDFRKFIVFASCRGNETLPTNAGLPADLFTSCMTTPVQTALRVFVHQNPWILPQSAVDVVNHLPGKINDRSTPLGQINWVLTAVTDAIAWELLPYHAFVKLFRDDLLLGSLSRNFLLACRLMRRYNCHPQMYPPLPTSLNDHPMWATWDLFVERVLARLPAIFAHYKMLTPEIAAKLDLIPQELSTGETPRRNDKNAVPIPHAKAEPKTSETQRASLMQASLEKEKQLLSQLRDRLTSQYTKGHTAIDTLYVPSPNKKISDSNNRVNFFDEQLAAFEGWIRRVRLQFPRELNEADVGTNLHAGSGSSITGSYLVYLPVVLQVMLSNSYRKRALQLLAQFCALGRWAVDAVFRVGIYPYVTRAIKQYVESNTNTTAKSNDQTLTALLWICSEFVASRPECGDDLISNLLIQCLSKFFNLVVENELSAGSFDESAEHMMECDKFIAACFVLCQLMERYEDPSGKEGSPPCRVNSSAQKGAVEESIPLLLLKLLCAWTPASASDKKNNRKDSTKAGVPSDAIIWALLTIGRCCLQCPIGLSYCWNYSAPDTILAFLSYPDPRVRATAIETLSMLFHGNVQDFRGSEEKAVDPWENVSGSALTAARKGLGKDIAHKSIIGMLILVHNQQTKNLRRINSGEQTKKSAQKEASKGFGSHLYINLGMHLGLLMAETHESPIVSRRQFHRNLINLDIPSVTPTSCPFQDEYGYIKDTDGFDSIESPPTEQTGASSNSPDGSREPTENAYAVPPADYLASALTSAARENSASAGGGEEVRKPGTIRSLAQALLPGKFSPGRSKHSRNESTGSEIATESPQGRSPRMNSVTDSGSSKHHLNHQGRRDTAASAESGNGSAWFARKNNESQRFSAGESRSSSAVDLALSLLPSMACRHASDISARELSIAICALSSSSDLSSMVRLESVMTIGRFIFSLPHELAMLIVVAQYQSVMIAGDTSERSATSGRSQNPDPKSPGYGGTGLYNRLDDLTERFRLLYLRQSGLGEDPHKKHKKETMSDDQLLQRLYGLLGARGILYVGLWRVVLTLQNDPCYGIAQTSHAIVQRLYSKLVVKLRAQSTYTHRASVILHDFDQHTEGAQGLDGTLKEDLHSTNRDSGAITDDRLANLLPSEFMDHDVLDQPAETTFDKVLLTPAAIAESTPEGLRMTSRLYEWEIQRFRSRERLYAGKKLKPNNSASLNRSLHVRKEVWPLVFSFCREAVALTCASMSNKWFDNVREAAAMYLSGVMPRDPSKTGRNCYPDQADRTQLSMWQSSYPSFAVQDVTGFGGTADVPQKVLFQSSLNSNSSYPRQSFDSVDDTGSSYMDINQRIPQGWKEPRADLAMAGTSTGSQRFQHAYERIGPVPRTKSASGHANTNQLSPEPAPRLPVTVVSSLSQTKIKEARSWNVKPTQKCIIDIKPSSMAATLLFHPYKSYIIIGDDSDSLTVHDYEIGQSCNRIRNSFDLSVVARSVADLQCESRLQELRTQAERGQLGSASRTSAYRVRLNSYLQSQRTAIYSTDLRLAHAGHDEKQRRGHSNSVVTETVKSKSASVENQETSMTSKRTASTRPRTTSLQWINEHSDPLLLCGSEDGSVRVWRNLFREGDDVQREPHSQPSFCPYQQMPHVSLGSDRRSSIDSYAAYPQEEHSIESFIALPDMHHRYLRAKASSSKQGKAKGSGLLTSWIPCNGSLAVAGNSPFVRVWDLDCAQCIGLMPSGSDSCVTSLTTSWPGSGVLVAGCGNGTITLLDTRDPQRRPAWTSESQKSLPRRLKEHKKWVVRVCQPRCGTGNALVSGSVSGEVKFWDLRKGATESCVNTLQAHNHPMTAMALHDYAPILATGSHSQNVKLWYTNPNGVPVDGASAARALSPDGNVGPRVDPQLKHIIRFHDGFLGQRIGPVSCLEFHPYEMLLGIGTVDNIVSLHMAGNKFDEDGM
eukprot:gb/GECG01009087.1/.p1 GENE.gb/GECG01009087.1/~~gb/GECG01009087.1/.p1  ORF type:complete len:2296 (+),score=216.87 gb/GECG01009087.1/:1-6888(+)